MATMQIALFSMATDKTVTFILRFKFPIIDLQCINFALNADYTSHKLCHN